MREPLVTFRTVFCFLTLCIVADSRQRPDPGKIAEQKSCLPCHSLRIVESQRLSTAAWAKEVDKMIGWGAVVPERQLLIDYLSQQYGDTKPLSVPSVSQNGVTNKPNSASLPTSKVP